MAAVGSTGQMANGLPVNQSQGPNARGLGGSTYVPVSSPLAFPGQLVYSNNVTPYGSSSLSGANPIPSTSALALSASLSATPKRKQSEDAPPSSAGRKRRATAVPQNDPAANGDEWSGEDGMDREEPDVGPNGGPKHWSDQEKNRLFRWMLCDNQHWDMFRSKMNTVFRDASKQMFAGRKSFTALKSCYHRNVETFKQIYAFEAFLARSHNGADGNPAPPVPDRFESPMARQTYLEQRLEAARAAGAPVANLTLKVIDHWHLQGWYTLFKSRFREDPNTGLPVPYYGPVTSISFPSHAPAEGASFNIDPRLFDEVAQEADGEHEDEQGQQHDQGQHHGHEEPSDRPGPSHDAALMTPPAATANTGDVSLIPPPFLGQRTHGFKRATRHSHVHTQPPPPIASPSHVLQPQFASQADEMHPPPNLDHAHFAHAQAVERLTAVAESLVESCNTLTQLVHELAADRRAVASGPPKADGFNRKEKATLATEVLANPDVGEEVRKAATDYLKRLFMSE